MSGGFSIGGALLATVGSMALQKVLAPKTPTGASTQQVQQVQQPGVQQTKTADPAAYAAKNANAALTGPLAGNTSTWLTGPQGVDENSLILGKNSKLGQ